MPHQQFPVGAFLLHESHEYYALGARFMIKTLENDIFLFRTREDMDRFASIHALEYLSDEELQKLRDSREHG